MDFISQTKEKYDIADEDKVLRIIIDYVMTSPELHSTVFTETRCLRWRVALFRQTGRKPGLPPKDALRYHLPLIPALAGMTSSSKTAT